MVSKRYLQPYCHDDAKIFSIFSSHSQVLFKEFLIYVITSETNRQKLYECKSWNEEIVADPQVDSR